jgi:hypothetical protein
LIELSSGRCRAPLYIRGTQQPSRGAGLRPSIRCTTSQ